MFYFNLVNILYWLLLICTLDYSQFLYVIMRDNALKVEDDIPVSDLLSHTPLHSIGSYKSIDASCQ